MKIKTNNPESNLVKSLFRDFQIQILEGRQFILNEKNYKEFVQSDRYNAYLKFAPGEIITGSNALKLLGLLDRDAKDIDIVIPEWKSVQFGKLQKLMYSTDDLENYIGTTWIKYKRGIFSSPVNIQFDFFKQVDTDILEFDKLKLENPLNIIRRKIEIADRLGFRYSEKHCLDLQHILTR
jgi:hypothetical protein